MPQEIFHISQELRAETVAHEHNKTLIGPYTHHQKHVIKYRVPQK